MYTRSGEVVQPALVPGCSAQSKIPRGLMARSDVLLDLVRAGAKGDQASFRKALEALVSDERAKQHHVLADRLAANLAVPTAAPGPYSAAAPRNGTPSNFVSEIHPSRRLEDLILNEDVLQATKELLEEQARSELLRAHNLEPRHRVMLAGPPGNGKTSLAEAIASELGFPLLLVRYEAVITSFLGETAVRLARMFEAVRTMRCVLFFDEFDVIGKERGDVHETGEIKRVVSSLLLQVDELPSHAVVVVATNHPELLDRAVWRRFQVRLHLAPPNPRQAEEWFVRFERRLGAKLGYAPDALAKSLRGLSFSELEQFALDVQRRYVLALPDADVRRIVSERLGQWEAKFSLSRKKPENDA